jgi:uncharacterized membrane protein YfcA
MPQTFEYLIIIIALFAYFLKGAMGFGPSLFIVSVGSLVIGPQSAIVVAAMLDVVAGAYLVYLDPIKKGHRYWLPMILSMTLGAVCGSILLWIIPKPQFDVLIGIAVGCIAAWFVFNGVQDEESLQQTLPEKCSISDISITFAAGTCGGLFGISGPVLIYHLGRTFAKRVIRQILVAIFLSAAIAKVGTYSLTGMIEWRHVVLFLASIPCLFAGIYMGNHVFLRLTEIWFRRSVGVVLFVIALRPILH